MAITAKQVQELRQRTGLGIMACKKALSETDGNVDNAIEALRKNGMAKAEGKADRATGDGIIHTYIHSNNKVGVMIELNCETDFVAKTDGFINLAKDICMHAAAMNPGFLKREDVPADLIAKEREIATEQVKGKPENIIGKIVDGKIEKFYKENCLLDQMFIKDDSKSIADLLKENISKVGENIQLRQFSRFEIGK